MPENVAGGFLAPNLVRGNDLHVLKTGLNNVQCLWCLRWQVRWSFNYIVMKLRSDQCLFCFVLALMVCVGRKNKNIVRLYLE